MASDRATGGILLIIGIVGILLYGWLLFFYNEGMTTLILQLTAFLGIAMILAIISWIGYTMATTTPPEPLDIGEVSEEVSSPETSDADDVEPAKKSTESKK